MDIDPKIAETIVANIKGVLQHEINLFDTTGTIIASTDKKRIGTGHDGARLAVELKHTIPIDNEHQFEGAKNGINVPVLFNDSVVAVIGITGKRDEVEPFGNIIKKMTEILIRENFEHATQLDQRMMMSNLINILITRRQDPGLVDYLSSMLDITLERPRFIVVGRPRGNDAVISARDRCYRTLHDCFRTMPQSFFSVTTQEICMFVDPDEVTDLVTFLRRLQSNLDKLLDGTIFFGVGDLASDLSCCSQSYDEACRTVDWLLFSLDQTIASYNDLDYGIFISSICPSDAHRFIDHVFNGITDDQISEFQTTFSVYRRHNGSIIHAADELFLHKNTLQNRLNKIAAVTGYNPRVLKDFTVLYTAFTLWSYFRTQR